MSFSERCPSTRESRRVTNSTFLGVCYREKPTIIIVTVYNKTPIIYYYELWACSSCRTFRVIWGLTSRIVFCGLLNISVLAFNVVVHTHMKTPEIFQVLTVLFTILLFTDKHTDFSGDYFLKEKNRLRVLQPLPPWPKWTQEQCQAHK